MLAGEDCADQVPIQNRSNIDFFNHDRVVGVGLSTRRRNVPTGVMDQNGNGSKSFGHFSHNTFDISVLSQISENSDCLHTVFFADLAGRVGQCGSFAVLGRTILTHAVNSDRAPQGCQTLGEGSPQTPSCSGHQSHLARQYVRHALFPSNPLNLMKSFPESGDSMNG